MLVLQNNLSKNKHTSKKRKLLLQKLVNLRKCHSLGLTLLNSHYNERNVAIGWLLGSSCITAVLLGRAHFLVVDV